MDLEVDDEMVWTGDPSGIFLVKSMIEVATQNVIGSLVSQSFIWKNLAPPRVHLFTCCCAKRKVLTRMDLRRRGLMSSEGDSSCPLCGLVDEMIDHLLATCPMTWKLWSYFSNLMGVSWVCPGSWVGLLMSWLFPSLGARRRLAWIMIPATIIWTIWKERIARIFEGKSLQFSELLEKTKWSLCVWLCTNKEFKDLKAGDLLQS